MSVQTVKTKIKEIYQTRIVQIDAISRYYAALAITYFNSVQPATIGAKGKFWTNRTGQAAARVFTKSFKFFNELGWLIAHGVDYGVYLEKCNDGKYAALWPIMKRFTGRYINDVRKLYEG